MKLKAMLVAAATAGAMSLSSFTPTIAAPLTPVRLNAEQSASVQQVQYRHWHGRHGWRHHHGWHGHRHYGTGAAVLGGLAAGAVIGGAIANSQAQANASAYCSQRYRSYDPASGTYLGYDGLRHPCP